MTSPSRQTLIRLAITVLALIVLWVVLIAPINGWKTEQLAAQQRAKWDLATLNERNASLRADLVNLDQHDLSGLFWSAAQAGEATALIQSDISTTASGHGILLRSVTPFTPRDSSIPGAFGFRLEFEAHLDQLSDFLKDVEYAAPALVVHSAILRRLNRPGATGEQPAVFAQIDILAPVRLTGEMN